MDKADFPFIEGKLNFERESSLVIFYKTIFYFFLMHIFFTSLIIYILFHLRSLGKNRQLALKILPFYMFLENSKYGKIFKDKSLLAYLLYLKLEYSLFHLS